MTPYWPRIEDWLNTDARTVLYRKVCDTVCPETPRRCLVSLYQHGTSLAGFYRHWTPMETIVTQDRYLRSRFAVAAFWRERRHAHDVAKSMRAENKLAFSPLPPKLACLANALDNGGTPWDRPEPEK